MAYISRLTLIRQALRENYDIIFTERSIYTDRNVFAKMLYDSGKIEGANKGDIVSVKLNSLVRENDKVYLVRKRE